MKKYHEISKRQKIFQKIIAEAKIKNQNIELKTLVKIVNHIEPDFLKGIDEYSANILSLPDRRCACDIQSSIDTGKDHNIGFEKEKLYHEALFGTLDECPGLKASTVRMIFSYIVPQIAEKLFKPRSCVRKLKYVGSENTYFKVGNIYESLDFTGATYTFTEYDNGKSRIGACYFEWIE